jgi:glycogen synthase
MHHLRQNGMQTQFSWKVTAEKYVAVYQKVLDS